MIDKKILVFDIETTNLKGNFGYCLAFGYKVLGESKTHVLSIADYKHHKKDPTNDAALMKDAHKILTDADIIVSYYGKGFDRKFLNTRMLLAGLPPLPPLNSEHIDLYFTAKYNLALNSNRLDMVARTLGCPMQKTALEPQQWVRAMAGDHKAIKYVVEHCREDVKVLEWCYLKLRPFVRQHPRVGEVGTCQNCGSEKLQRRGKAVVTSGKPKVRTQCQECGRWGTVGV